LFLLSVHEDDEAEDDGAMEDPDLNDEAENYFDEYDEAGKTNRCY
jgi:hypothetical protein